MKNSTHVGRQGRQPCTCDMGINPEIPEGITSGEDTESEHGSKRIQIARTPGQRQPAGGGIPRCLGLGTCSLVPCTAGNTIL